MSKHTPGPWAVPAWPNMQPPVVAAGQTICRTDTGACPVDSRANARLIAAAPELMEALKLMIEWFGGPHEKGCPEDDTCSCKAVALVIAAVKKAAG